MKRYCSIFAFKSLMFLHSTPGYRPGPGSILALTLRFSLATHYTRFGWVGPSIIVRGTAAISDPLLQCAVPTPHLQLIKIYLNWNDEFPRKYKDQQKPTKRNLNIVVPALLQTGRSTLAPRHSKYLRTQPFLTNAWAWAWPLMCPKINGAFR